MTSIKQCTILCSLQQTNLNLAEKTLQQFEWLPRRDLESSSHLKTLDMRTIYHNQCLLIIISIMLKSLLKVPWQTHSRDSPFLLGKTKTSEKTPNIIWRLSSSHQLATGNHLSETPAMLEERPMFHSVRVKIRSRTRNMRWRRGWRMFCKMQYFLIWKYLSFNYIIQI